MGCTARAAEASLTLTVQPVMSETRTREAFLPLAEYLGRAAGAPVEVVTARNFLTAWLELKRGQGASVLVLGPSLADVAHRRHAYTYLAKVEGTVSYSLVTRQDQLLLDPQELVGKKVATMPMPSMLAVRLAELFPDPVRAPREVMVDSTETAVDKLLAGEVTAAMIPNALVGRYESLDVLATTDPMPHMAVLVAPGVDADTRERLRAALLSARDTDAGREMLRRLSFSGFEPAAPALYDGYGKRLERLWPYL
jgi:phosphonate transport system substrate-binding protein